MEILYGNYIWNLQKSTTRHLVEENRQGQTAKSVRFCLPRQDNQKIHRWVVCESHTLLIRTGGAQVHM